MNEKLIQELYTKFEGNLKEVLSNDELNNAEKLSFLNYFEHRIFEYKVSRIIISNFKEVLK